MTTAGIIDLPQITWRPLVRQQPQIVPSAYIAHTAVSGASSLFGYFSSPAAKGIESHLYIRTDGTGEQYISVEMQADANGAANRWWDPVIGKFRGAVSAETQDGGNPATPWTPAQVETLAEIGCWLHERYGVPLELCPTPQSPGLGWHSMWPAPNPWSPGNHTCPGPVRIDQFKTQVVPLIQAKAAPRPPVIINQQGETMFSVDIVDYATKAYALAGYDTTDKDVKNDILWWVLTATGSPDPTAVLKGMCHGLGLKGFDK